MLGDGRWMMLHDVLIPGAMPFIFTGLRLSLQACWTTLVAGELIGAAAGLGRVLAQGALDFFFQAEDGIRDRNVTGVQTCALPIFKSQSGPRSAGGSPIHEGTLLAGRYRVMKMLGAGGMGTVFEARREDLGNMRVAVKVLDRKSVV